MSWSKRNAPAILLAAALAVGFAMTVVLTWKLTFYQDSWDLLINRRDPTLDALLDPHNEHIVLFPALIEQVFLRLFGMSTALPDNFMLAVGLVATAAIVYVYVARRVGSWLALFATILLLCLGAAWEVLLWPFEIGFIGSIFFGIAMLLAIERSDRRGDIAACAFLVASLGFSSLGISFIAAAAVAIALGPRERWLPRAYVVVIPALLFVVWYLGWGHQAETHVTLRNILASPLWVANGVAMAVGSLFGLDVNTLNGASEPVWGRVILAGLVIAVVIRLFRRPTLYPGIWPVAAAAASNWFLAAFNQTVGRDPSASRYQYAGAILIVLLLANIYQGSRPGKKGIVIGAIVTALAIGPGLVVLKDAKAKLEQQSALTKADLGALDIAQRTVDPEFVLSPEVAGTPSLINVMAGKYLLAVDEYGSPGYTAAELEGAPDFARRQADVVLAAALPISVTTQGGSLGAGGADCVTVEGGSGNEVELSPGVTAVEVAPGPRADLALRRFATGEYPVATEGAAGGTVTRLRIPRDEASQPWFLRVEASQPARVCS